MSRFLILLFLFCPLFLLSQLQKIDSFKSILTTVNEDSIDVKLNIFNNLSTLYRSINTDSSLLYTNKLLEYSVKNSNFRFEAIARCQIANSTKLSGNIADGIIQIKLAIPLIKKIKDTTLLIKAYNLNASLLNRQEKYKDAIGILNEGLTILKNYNNNSSIASFYLELGNSYTSIGDHEQALTMHQKAKKLYEEANDLMGVSNCLNNIGNLYQSIREFEKGEAYFLESISIAKKINENRKIATGYVNLSSILCTRITDKNKSKLISYIDSSMKYITLIHSDYLMSIVLHNKGHYFKHSNKLDSAILYYKLSIESSSKLQDSLSLMTFIMDYGIAQMLKGNKTEGLDKLKICYDYAKRGKDINLLENTLLSYGLATLRSQEYKTAAYLYKELVDVSDSLLNQEKQKAIIELETKYETEKKECIITQQNLEIKNKNMGLGLVGGGLLGAIGLSTLLYRKRRQEQELNQLLDQQNRVLQDANQGLLRQLSIQRESDEVAQEPLMITLSNGSQSTVNIDDIQYFEAENNIVKIVLADGTVRHDYQRLKNFTELLKDSAMFIQIHRSYLVNVNHVTSHRANDLKMRSGDTLPIGITLKEKVHAKLNEKGV